MRHAREQPGRRELADVFRGGTCMSPTRSGNAALVTGALDKRGHTKPRLRRWLSVVAVSLATLSFLATSAEAAAPAVTFTPTSLTFGAQAIGTTSAAQSVTIANTGNAPLFINSAQTRGANPLDFTEVSDGCSGLTLAAGTSCSVSINFSPTATGTRSGTLIVTDNGANSPQTVPVTGTGTGTNPPLAIDTRFMTCTGSVCDLGANPNVS